MDRWFAVARSEEVGRRHVVQIQLLGQEVAVWRDDTGAVNAWANRCPHRGVRLSIGVNAGAELRCRYHGWRFAAGTGQCTFIPAHPTQRPAGTLHATVFPACERHGFVWVSIGREPGPPSLPAGADNPTTLRSIFIEAPVPAVAAALMRGYHIDSATAVSVTAPDAFTVTAVEAGAAWLLQPVTDSQTVIHGYVWPQVAAVDRMGVLRHHNLRMTLLRDQLEAAAHPAQPQR